MKEAGYFLPLSSLHVHPFWSTFCLCIFNRDAGTKNLFLYYRRDVNGSTPLILRLRDRAYYGMERTKVNWGTQPYGKGTATSHFNQLLNART